MRLQKYLASCGVASRRKCETYILEGLVTVNGEIVETLGTQVKEDDVVCFKGKEVYLQNSHEYYMLNKPIGYVTTANDERGRQTVLDLMKGIKSRIYPVGRLDYNTSGLLLLTDDGNLTYGLTHPKHHVDKTYEVKVKGKVSEDEVKLLCTGVLIDGRKTYPAKVQVLTQGPKSSRLQISIHEGRNRQIRKMCEAVGHEVLSLKRLSVGELTLGQLKIGEYRALTPKEVAYIKQIAGTDSM